MAAPIVLIQTAVLAITLLKIWQIIRSNIWMWRCGAAYALERRRLEDSSQSPSISRDELLDSTGGAVFPFGVKSYRLRRWLRKGRTSLGMRLLTAPVWLFYILFAFYVYPVVTSAYIISASFLFHSKVALYLCFTVGCLLMIGCLGIAFEAVLSYVFLSGWGIYHELARGDRVRIASEFSIATGALLMAYVSGVGLTCVAAVGLGAFAKIGPGGVLPTVGLCVYYCLIEMLQAGDADPQAGAGRLAVALIELDAAVFVLIVLALVLGRVGSAVASANAEPAVLRNPEPVKPGQSWTHDKIGTPASHAGVGLALLLILMIIKKFTRSRERSE